MHELSIAMSIVDLVEEEMTLRGVEVEAVHIKVGLLSGVVKDALLSSYEMACMQTPLEGSRLVIEDVPILVDCPNCKARRPVRSMQWFCCADCGTPTAEVVEGRELLVTALELRQ